MTNHADPLADISRTAPDADLDPNSAEARKIQAARLAAEARRFVNGDALAASPYANMAPAALAVFSGYAGSIQSPGPGGVPHVYPIAVLAPFMTVDELRAVMVYRDARAAEEGRSLAYVPEVLETPAPRPAAPAKPRLPASPSRAWKVMATAAGIAMPGGLFTLNAGAILEEASYSIAVLESLIDQGVKLRPHPETALDHGDRIECAACGTSWPAPIGRDCPTCYLTGGGDPGKLLREAAAPLEAEIDRLAALIRDGGEVEAGLRERLRALTGWAVAQGAREPDEDGLWQGEMHPPALELAGFLDPKGRGVVTMASAQEGASSAPAFDVTDVEAPPAEVEAPADTTETQDASPGARRKRRGS